MSFFNPLEGTALLRSKGVYTEAELFEYDNAVFAKWGKGHIRLLSHERTSLSSVSWTNIQGVKIQEHQGYVVLDNILTAAA